MNPPKETANKLKLDLLAYRDLLVELSEGNITLEKNLNDVFDIEREDFGKKQNQTWEQYNFQDMPAVGALTILSKIQADIRNMESDVVSYLRTSLGKNDLKFDAGGEAVVSASNLVFLNDTFRAEIFLAPKNSQNPEIYIGEYDELSDGTYEMRGDYETIKVRNGKGYYATRATSEGSKEYGGLIVMKTESGDKKFPFKKDYKVAKVEGIVSIDLMNKVFQGIDNPITVSVPGYTADQIDVRCTDCQYPPKKINIKTGQWEINPKTLTNKAKPLVRLFVKSDDGGWKPMGEKFLRVVPAGTPTITFGLKGKGKGTRADIITKGIFANSSDRDLRSKLKYEIKGYSWKKGGAKQYTIVELDQKGPVKWDAKFKKAVESSQIGQSLIIKDVIYRQKCPTCKPIKIEDQKYVIEIE